MEKNTNSDFIAFAQKIESLNPLILSEWEKMLLSHLVNRKRESFVILIDHMPEILSGLVNSLKRGIRDEMEAARAHGFQRAVLTQFSITDVLDEYSLLRETLVSYLYPIGNLECARFLHWYIDLLTKNSVLEFINILPSTSKRINETSEEPDESNPAFS